MGDYECTVYVPKAEIKTIQKNTYYYLQKNEYEEWELHRTDLRSTNGKDTDGE